MTRGPLKDMQDPIDVLKSNEDRNTAQAADLLNLLGWCISAGQLEKLQDAKRAKGFSTEGKISDAKLVALVKKPPTWLSESHHPKTEEGMVTIRQAVELYPGLKFEQVVDQLVIGKRYFIVTEQRQRFIVLHVSWIDQLAKRLKLSRRADKLAVPTRAIPAVSRSVPKASVSVPEKEPKKQISTNDLVVSEPPKPITIEKSAGDLDIISLMEATSVLQTYGFDVTYNDIYRAATQTKPVKFEVVRKSRLLFVSIAVLEKLVDEPPTWLKDVNRRFEAPAGFSLTRDVLINNNNIVMSRLYEAISARLVKAETLSSGEGQGKLFAIEDAEVKRMLAEDALCRFLRGDDVTIPEIEAARLERASIEPKSEHHPTDIAEAPEDAEVIRLVEPNQRSSEPVLTLAEALLRVHNARRIVAKYDELMAACSSEDVLVSELSSLIRAVS